MCVGLLQTSAHSSRSDVANSCQELRGTNLAFLFLCLVSWCAKKLEATRNRSQTESAPVFQVRDIRTGSLDYQAICWVPCHSYATDCFVSYLVYAAGSWILGLRYPWVLGYQAWYRQNVFGYQVSYKGLEYQVGDTQKFLGYLAWYTQKCISGLYQVSDTQKFLNVRSDIHSRFLGMRSEIVGHQICGRRRVLDIRSDTRGGSWMSGFR
jgi:hypothetical protein